VNALHKTVSKLDLLVLLAPANSAAQPVLSSSPLITHEQRA
jgi:hypothetical protein